MHYQDFLADPDRDARRAFAETLIEALKFQYADRRLFGRLNALAATFPDLSDELMTIIDPLADLLPVTRKGIYFPAAEFSNSIKSVGPACVLSSRMTT